MEGVQAVEEQNRRRIQIAKEWRLQGKIHRYTEKSRQRFVICSVLIAGAIIYAGFRSKTHLQTLAES